MRVVADTNTVVSAFLWGGLPAEILVAARERRISLHTSPALLVELEEVLSREKFATRIARVGSSAAQMIAGYRALATPVRPADEQLSCIALFPTPITQPRLQQARPFPRRVRTCCRW